jgi:hypothetical protein
MRKMKSGLQHIQDTMSLQSIINDLQSASLLTDHYAVPKVKSIIDSPAFKETLGDPIGQPTWLMALKDDWKKLYEIFKGFRGDPACGKHLSKLHDIIDQFAPLAHDCEAMICMSVCPSRTVQGQHTSLNKDKETLGGFMEVLEVRVSEVCSHLGSMFQIIENTNILAEIEQKCAYANQHGRTINKRGLELVLYTLQIWQNSVRGLHSEVMGIKWMLNVCWEPYAIGGILPIDKIRLAAEAESAFDDAVEKETELDRELLRARKITAELRVKMELTKVEIAHAVTSAKAKAAALERDALQLSALKQAAARELEEAEAAVLERDALKIAAARELEAAESAAESALLAVTIAKQKAEEYEAASSAKGGAAKACPPPYGDPE